jgi:asparagine synthase (glutamine-hydrolysing)
MCGIAGLTKSLITESSINNILVELKERGPDYSESKDFGEIILLHSRLKIIDLSAIANQPMCNEDGSIWLVFNGEIYNHKILREQLEQNGHIFKSHTDSEVIIHLYEERGEDIWMLLEGMFAIAIYDSNKNKLLLGRDRFGIKPLFYYQKGIDFGFASNINALKKTGNVDLTINKQAIFDFTAFLYIPAPLTFYENIYAMLPGECIVVDFVNANLSSVRKLRFHEWGMAVPDEVIKGSENHVIVDVQKFLNAAVRSQIESDVKFGALLSGGIDSSLISAIAQKQLDGEKLNTFNVKFPDAINDETWAALVVAKHIGSNHITLKMEEKSGSWEELHSVLKYCGQPFADTSIFAVNKVAELVSKHVTVCLSGDGGDEAFAGYSTFLQTEKVYRLKELPKLIQRIIFLIAGLHRFAPKPLSDFLRKISYFKDEDETGIIQSFHTWIRKSEHVELIQNHQSYLPVRRFFEPIVKKAKRLENNALEKLTYIISLTRTELHLPNDYLFKVDAGTMMASIENRVPFLNEELFNFGLNLPRELKLKHNTNKYLLRKIATRELPKEITEKPKGGFGLPIDLWVNDNCRTEIVNRITFDTELPKYLNREYYMMWVNAFYNRSQIPGISREGLYQRIIMLISLHIHLHETGTVLPGIDSCTSAS